MLITHSKAWMCHLKPYFIYLHLYVQYIESKMNSSIIWSKLYSYADEELSLNQ